VQPFDGDLDDYQRWLLEQSREAQRAARASRQAEAPAPAPAPAAPPPPSAARKDDRKAAAQARTQRAERTRPLRREAERIDAELAALGREKAELEAALGAGTLAPAALAEHGRRLKRIDDETSVLEERWLALQAEIEAIDAAG
jgi:ATP-binding cassette subfamily F protein 3